MPIDFKLLADDLLFRANSILPSWLPNGKIRVREFVVGNLNGDKGDSLSINLDTGVWKDFAAGQGGADLISLYAAIKGMKQSEAAKHLGGSETKTKPDEYLIGRKCTHVPQNKLGTPTDMFEYVNENGKITGYICRFEPLNEKKQFIPLTFWKRANGEFIWKWKKWPGHSVIYRLPALLENKDKKVLIVEGERKADRAQKLIGNDWVVVGWCGGAENVKGTNWEHLKNRYCWIWPDNDEPGKLAANILGKILPQLKIVSVPVNFESGWDLGDAKDGFNIEAYLKEELAVTVINKHTHDSPSTAQIQNILTHLDPVNMRPLCTIENLRDMLDYYKIRCCYNVISKKNMYLLSDESFSVENATEAAFACIYSRMKEWKMSVDGYRTYLFRIADENQYNPVLEWIKRKPWDGRSRLQDFYNTIVSPETEAKELLLRRWLIGAVCMALYEGIDGAGCLVLQGKQDIGKTWWVRKLVSEEVRKEFIRTDTTLDPKDKDSVKQIISYWIVELGEIGATFRKSDIDALKSFITRDHDIIRKPYDIEEKYYPRRTALIASVDQSVYLNDTAGNRRFWTIPCVSINSHHTIDMQQLWAEVLELVNAGEKWQLEPDEKEHIARINNEHIQTDPIIEMMTTHFNFESSYCDKWLTATQIAESLNLKIISQKETRIIASFMRKMGIKSRSVKGMTVYNIEKFLHA